MLGLGLGISKTAGLRSLAVKLLSKLKFRSTYYENGEDSKEFLEVLAGTELLDDATIVLTPTATSNARVHSVKTYTGDELITNGDFATDLSGWDLQGTNATNTITWETNGARIISTGVNIGLAQTSVLTIGKTYKLTCDVAITVGKIGLDGATSGLTVNMVEGFNEIIFTAISTTFKIKRITGNDNCLLDNVSIVDVSSDFDFDRASSATRINSDGLVQDMQSITDPELVLNGDFEELGDEEITNGGFDTSIAIDSAGSGWKRIINGDNTVEYGGGGVVLTRGSDSSTNECKLYAQTPTASSNILTVGKFYKLTYTVVNNTNVTLLRYYIGGSYQDVPHSVGTHTHYFKQASNQLSIFWNQTTSSSITLDNVSVKEVGQNWTLGTGWSIEDGKLKSNGTINVTAFQENVFSQSGNTYKIKFDVNVASGSLSTRVRMGDSVNGHTTISNITSEDSYTLYATAVANQDNLNFTTLSDNTAVYTIDNVSVKDVTFSEEVDLARINYDTNGDNGHILLEPTSTNLQDYSENFDEWTHANGDFTITNELAPDGKTKVYKSTVANDSASAHFYTGPPVLVVGEKYTASYFFKYVDHPWVRITHISSSNTGVWFNLQSGTIGTENGTSVGKIEDYGNGWYRCSNTFTATQAAATTNVFGAVSEDNGGTNGVANKNVLVWGAQVENLEYPTSYIPVHSTSNVTRAAETLNGSGNSTLINTTEGTLYLESKPTALSGTKVVSVGGGANGADPCVLIGYANNKVYFDVIDSTAAPLTPSVIATPADRQIDPQDPFGDSSLVLPAFDTETYNKMAISYTATEANIYLNGHRISTQFFDFTPSTNLIDELKLGFSGGSHLYAATKAVTVFNRALADDELELLTGVTNYPSFGALAAAGGYTII